MPNQENRSACDFDALRHRRGNSLRFFLPKHVRASTFTLVCVFAFLLIFSPVLANEESPAAGTPITSASEIAYPPFCVVHEDGSVTGFANELLRAALAAMGREVTFRTGPWTEVRGWLEKGEVQALPLVGRTPEREKQFDFTVPYMTLHGAIVVQAGVTGITGLDDLKGRKVAVMLGDNAEEFLRREERGIEIHTAPTFEAALTALSEGRHDAVVIQRLVALRLIAEMGLANVRVLNKPIEGFRQDFCFAVKEGDRDTLALLNEGLALVMADGTFAYLHAKWFAALELPSHRRIVIGGDHNFPPFEFLDENGRPTGYNVELAGAIAHELGLDIEIRLGPWAEITDQLARGKVDAVPGMFYSAERDLTFDFTPAHIVNHSVSVVRAGEGAPPTSIDELKGKRIVVQQGDIMHDFVVENGLADHLSVVDSQENALRELSEGKYDCALVSRSTALYWIKETGWTNLVVGRKAIHSPEYCFAVANNRKALLAQLTEGLKVVEKTGEYRRIYEKWMGVYDEPTLSSSKILKRAALVAAPLLIVLFVVLLWSWSLRKQVAVKTRELRESAEQFQYVFEAANVGKSLTLPGGELKANQAFADYLGYERDELQVKTWQEVTPPEDIEAFTNAIAPLLAGKTDAARFEKQYIRKDGEHVWGDVSVVIRRDAQGNPLHFITTIVDINAQKKAEEALRSSEKQYRLLADNTLDVIWTMDLNFEFTYVNPAIAQLTGHTPEEWVGSRLPEHCDEASFSTMAQVIAAEMAKGKEHSGAVFETAMLKKNGESVPVEIHGTVIFDATGAPALLQGVTRDITERKKSERELRSQAELLEAMFDKMPVMITFYKPSLQVLTANHAFEEKVGWTNEELKTINLMEEVYPDPEYREIATDFMERAPGEWKEFVIRTKDGQNLNTAWMNIVLSDDTRIGIGLDLTNEKRAEEEQRRLEEQLHQSQKMESIGRLAGGVAHDFNNLLTAIQGFAELVHSGLNEHDPARKDVEEVQKAADSAAALTSQLLAFSRKQIISPKVVDVNESVAAAEKMLQRIIGEDIELIFIPRDNIGRVLVDPGQINQVLVNLGANARDALPRGGTLTIETSALTLDEKECQTCGEPIVGDFVRLAVSDNGFGMDEETLKNVFEPFFTTKDMGKGTGLGLSTIHGIVHQNNGHINVYSELGQGTTFKIYLPVVAAEGDAPAAPVEAVYMTGTETILLVEDQDVVRKLAKRSLESQGYRIIEAQHGVAALKVFEERGEEIDLLLTDVIMPELSGKQLYDRLVVDRPDLKALFMSGYTESAIANHGVLEKGINFIQKPFRPRELNAKVRQVLDA
jgi:PAS domain S-box-containing protein